jgi:hypothetical protein
MRTLESDTQAAAAAVDTLIDFVNGWNPDQLAQIMLERVTRSHRTLQQSLLGAIKLMVEAYAQPETGVGVDLRNQSAYGWAMRVLHAEMDQRRNGIRFPHV